MRVFVAHLQQQLLEATDRTRRLEEQVNSMQTSFSVQPVKPDAAVAPSIHSKLEKPGDQCAAALAVEKALQDTVQSADGIRRAWTSEGASMAEHPRDQSVSPSTVSTTTAPTSPDAIISGALVDELAASEPRIAADGHSGSASSSQPPDDAATQDTGARSCARRCMRMLTRTPLGRKSTESG